MEPNMASKVGEGQSENKARDTLDQMSLYRIDPTRIKIGDSTPRGRGGQGVVILGTLTSFGAPKISLSQRLEELLHTSIIEGLIRDGPDGVSLEAVDELLSNGPTKLLAEAFANVHFGRHKVLNHDDAKKLVLESFKAFGRKVAIKKLAWPRDDVGSSTKFFKSFVNEVSLTASLSHPNIIEFLGFVEDIDKGDAWIVLPWQSNGNIREFLQSGEWDIPERISLIRDTADGLEYLHSRNPPICHGDLKSLNILVNCFYRAVITDFGSARIKRKVSSEKDVNAWETLHQGLVRPDTAPQSTSQQIKFDPATLDLTLTGPAYSLRWTAPEVLDDGMQDLPSDMWAMGWICWEIVTGKFPFEQLHRTAGIIQHALNGKLPAIREDTGLSHVLALCSLMSDCWLLEPDKRIDASMFRRKTLLLPSSTPSGVLPDGQKARSADLFIKLGTMYALQDDSANAEAHYLSAFDTASRTNDDLTMAKALIGLGSVYTTNLNLEKAENSLKQAHEIGFRLGDTLCIAETLDGLAALYKFQSKYREAEKACNDALEAYSRIGNDLGTAGALLSLGRIYRAQSRKQEAENAFMEAFEIQSRIGNDSGCAGALTSLGELNTTWLKNQEAFQAFNEAYKIFSRIGNHLGAANALNALGDAYFAQSSFWEAEKTFNDAHEIYSRIGHDLGTGNTLVCLGDVHRLQSKSREAEEAFMEAHEIHSRICHDMGMGAALRGLGNTYREQSKDEMAEGVFMQARNMLSFFSNLVGAGKAPSDPEMTDGVQSKSQEAFIEAQGIHPCIGHPSATARGMHEPEHISRAQSTIQNAEKVCTDSSTIHSPIVDHLHAGTAPYSPGMRLSDQYKYNEAELCYSQALACYRRANDAENCLETLLDLGTLYRVHHKYLEAEEAFTEALAIWTSMEDEMGQVKALVHLSLSFNSQSRHTEEMDVLIQAENILSRVGADRGLAMIWYLVGGAQHAQGMHDEALESYRLAQAIFLSLGYTRGEVTVLSSLGKLYFRLCRVAEAEECYAQARPLYVALSDEIGEAHALDGLMVMQSLQSKFGEAKRAYMEASELYKRIGQPMSTVCTHTWKLLQDVEDLDLSQLPPLFSL